MFLPGESQGRGSLVGCHLWGRVAPKFKIQALGLILAGPPLPVGHTFRNHFIKFTSYFYSTKYNAKHYAMLCYAKSLQSCPTVRPHRRQPTRLPRPWDSPGKNTGVGCHFLLQCMKVKSESEVAQSCPILSDPMDCSLPGSSIHGIFQARVLEWGATAFSDHSLHPNQISGGVPPVSEG